MTMNIYSTCTKYVCHSYYQLLMINLSNIVLRVNIQINKHFDSNEYFIAMGINIQCLYTWMAIGHIYTNRNMAQKSYFGGPNIQKLATTLMTNIMYI